MRIQHTGAYASSTGIPSQRARARTRGRGRLLRDLRERGGRGPRALTFAAGDLVVVSGLPGSGKSTLMKRAAEGGGIDSQDTREHWEARMPRLLPYALYRPLVRLAHYARLRRALRSGAGVIVHDCGTQSWVRGWLAREARRRGRALHLILLDVTPGPPARASAPAAGASPPTPSPGTGGPSAGSSGPPSPAACRTAAPP